MEKNNAPLQLSASDILKESNAKDLCYQNMHFCFASDVKTCSQSSQPDKTDSVFDDSAASRPNNDPDAKKVVNEGKSPQNVTLREYAYRASSMRSKIEEKISEIEEKINTSDNISGTESVEIEISPPDYNAIRVLDARRSRSCSVSEMRQSTIDRLQSKLEKAEKDLVLREEEVIRLRKIRDEVGSEIEDLTASLFEEANNMVKNAYQKQYKAEKIAKEANMKLAMLQEEVGALKTMVQSFKLCPTDKSSCNQEKTIISQRETYEVDPIFNKEFVAWRQNPHFDKENPFLKKIYEEDIYPCLNFHNTELSSRVLAAIEDDKIIIEKIPCNKNEALSKQCALMDAPRLCPYKMYLGDGDFFTISTMSRNRIASICDLFCYFRYIEKGFISQSIHEVYLEVLKKRRKIASAKLGLNDDIIE